MCTQVAAKKKKWREDLDCIIKFSTTAEKSEEAERKKNKWREEHMLCVEVTSDDEHAPSERWVE